MLSSVRLYWYTFQPVSSEIGLHAPASHPFGQSRRFQALPVATQISAVDPAHCFVPGVHCTGAPSPASAVPSADASTALVAPPAPAAPEPPDPPVPPVAPPRPPAAPDPPVPPVAPPPPVPGSELGVL